IYTLYRALKVFAILSAISFLSGTALGVRFLILRYVFDAPGRHIQSLILCAVLLNLSFMLFVLGVLADLIGFNRRLLHEVLYHTRKVSLDLQEHARNKKPSDIPLSAEDTGPKSTASSGKEWPRPS
ncbi:hypothetical protein HQ520_00575, partial [bacterium]|nr:hypothetical protein [bacterium]